MTDKFSKKCCDSVPVEEDSSHDDTITEADGNRSSWYILLTHGSIERSSEVDVAWAYDGTAVTTSGHVILALFEA